MKIIASIFAAALLCGAVHAEPKLSAQDSARILREAERIAKADSREWVFLIVEEKASGRFIQFYADDGKIAADVVAISASLSGATGSARDAQCSSDEIQPAADEIEKRMISIEEERRILEVHGWRGQWRRMYCVSMSPDEHRVGYIMSLTGFVGEPAAVPAFVESFFRDVLRLESIDGIKIETDQG